MTARCMTLSSTLPVREPRYILHVAFDHHSILYTTDGQEAQGA